MILKAITGSPKAGKTTLSKQFTKAGYHVIHTDDYIDYGWVESQAAILSAVKESLKENDHTLVEGVTVSKILVQLEQLGCKEFIRCITPPERREDRHKGMRTTVTKKWTSFASQYPGITRSIILDIMTPQAQKLLTSK